MKKYTFISLMITLFISPGLVFAEAVLTQEVETFPKARVTQVTNERKVEVIGTQAISSTQTLEALILGGDKEGVTVTFQNDYTQLQVGDIFYARHQVNKSDNTEFWSVSDPYRLDILLYLGLLFIFLIFVFGGIQGVRGLASLVGSFFLIFYILIPGIYVGYNAIFVSVGVSALIIIVGSYVTHGYNRTTTSAVLGMVTTVLLTGLAAYYVVDVARLSGFSSDESTFLNIDTKGAIDMAGLLFGGIMIGLLGVLYDSAIGQAVSIEELFRANKLMTRGEVYNRGIRIGREHIGALVNTLAIAYVGASLPLLLLLQSSDAGVLFILNNEIFATEIVRILIGSIGLILAVPITTAIAAHMLHGIDFSGNIRVRHSHKH